MCLQGKSFEGVVEEVNEETEITKNTKNKNFKHKHFKPNSINSNTQVYSKSAKHSKYDVRKVMGVVNKAFQQITTVCVVVCFIRFCFCSASSAFVKLLL